jgi:hypothetical protein
MSDVQIEGRSADKATLLLAAAEDLGLDAGVVRTTSGGYLVPEDVADKAGLSEGEKPKKTAAKKTTAKKTAASKPKGEE